MRMLDYAMVVAVACVAAAVTLMVLAPSFGPEARCGREAFARVSEPTYDPQAGAAASAMAPETTPTIVESESARPQEWFDETAEDAVWDAPEPIQGVVSDESEHEPDTGGIGRESAPEPPEAEPVDEAEDAAGAVAVGPEEYREAGVTVQGGTRYTWYSAHEPGGEVDAECEADADGVYRDADGYIVVASGDLGMGDVVETPLGDGKVYDRCPTPGTVDVYVDWRSE